MHPNEMKVTEENIMELVESANSLGERHLEALLEQTIRQNVKGLDEFVKVIQK